jgi:uncharacterized protein YutE (UPF0331/DUF86 family)
MGDLDKELLRRKLEYLREYLDKLKEFSSMEETVFLSDHHNYGLSEHYLQQAIEVILDVCRHIVIALELKTPEDSRALFSLLSDAGVLPVEYAKKNSNMAGFRNRLVHEYADIDHKKVYNYLVNYFPELEKFIAIISDYAQK